MGVASSVNAERGGDERDDVAVTRPAEATRAADSSDSGSGASWAPPHGAAADVADAADEGRFEWPFESLAEAAEWWYRPVIEARSWLALAYLFVGAIWAPFAFAVALTAMVIVFGLSLVGVGLLLIVPLFGLINSFATLERRRTEWVGDAVTAREFHERGSGYWGETRARLADSTRWRQVAFIAASVVVCPVLFALGGMPWVIVLQLATGGGFGSAATLGGLLVAALVIGAAPRATIFVAGVARSYVAWFLGPDETAELAERVEELAAQRGQILEAVDGERRRIERNLHDGVQQQLVALGIDVARARARVDDDPEGARALLDDARDKVRASIGELRLIGRGLHPAVLDDRGLDAALSSVVAGSPIPVTVTMTTARDLPDDVATTAYYVASEAVANILKHSNARVASVRVVDEPGPTPAIRITIHDDGRGGADADRGSGLAGMRARVEGVDGSFRVDSPKGGPTTIVAVIPLTAPIGAGAGRG
jgi:signal transduction histidine kinase